MPAPPVTRAQPLTLDVGCGINKFPGAVGIDRIATDAVDVVVELDQFPYPFADRSFDAVRAVHVIEHVSDVIRTMEEFWRLLKPGGSLYIATPHYTDFSSFCDPTHKWHLNSFSLRYFGSDHAGFGYYTHARFDEKTVRVKLLSLWRWFGLEFLVNSSKRFRRFWEHYLCFVFRGKYVEWQLTASKQEIALPDRADVGRPVRQAASSGEIEPMERGARLGPPR